MTIYEQLSEYCDCIKSVKKSDIDELISLISVYTCWTQKPCDTLLSGERTEVIDIPDCVCDCDVFTFDPFYVPFDVDSFEFTLVAQTGIEEELTPITEFSYSEIDKDFKISLPIPNCRCKGRSCGCPTKYKLLVTYVAGYKELPECLLPIMCEALQYIIEKNKCDCDSCPTCDKKYEDDQTEVVIANAAKLTDRLHYWLSTMLTEQYKRALSQISLCERNGELWGFRV